MLSAALSWVAGTETTATTSMTSHVGLVCRLKLRANTQQISHLFFHTLQKPKLLSKCLASSHICQLNKVSCEGVS